jgi:hypothetical protein
MGFAHSDTFAQLYDDIKGFIPEGNRREVANIIYDAAGDLDTDDWDGDTDLERDGGINQDLDT